MCSNVERCCKTCWHYFSGVSVSPCAAPLPFWLEAVDIEKRAAPKDLSPSRGAGCRSWKPKTTALADELAQVRADITRTCQVIQATRPPYGEDMGGPIQICTDQNDLLKQLLAREQELLAQLKGT